MRCEAYYTPDPSICVMLIPMRKEIEQAVALLAEKNPQSVERALELLQGTVFSFSLKVCGQREDAEDTMQEVLVKSLPYLPKFENPRALLVWLYKVAKSRCLMNRRRSKFAPLRQLSLEELMPNRQELERISKEGPLNPESLAIRSQQARRLREAIQKLPPHYRIILVMRDMEGLTDEEVGEITGLRPGTVRVRLHRARLFVRKQLAVLSSKQRTNPRPRRLLPVSNDVSRPRRCKAMFAELSNYLDEQLDDSMCESLEKHLDGCQQCKAFLASLESTIQQLRKAPSDDFNKATAAALRRKMLSTFPSLLINIDQK
jgi:RNA polymerase sigma-70 factor, ECF subfamily